MAESLLFSIAQAVLGKIASPALQEAVAIYNVEDHIRELRETLTAIKAVLSDAEEQKAKNHRLEVWLDRLQDVFYDAEDVLDELECDALRNQVISRYGSIRGKLLMRPEDKKLSVIPIVGIGGMGKTTLAKLVYNDDVVKEQFELRIWVCVRQDFNLKKTIEEIIKDTTGESSSNFDIQQLQTRLRGTIKDKKYLLVLDDVWSNDRSRWKELRNLLSEGASKSRIIVTTRSLEVASIMGTHPPHNLKGLSHKDSMTLFKKWAFDEKEKEPRPELLEIGNDIVERSQGLPLLVKTLGSLLYSNDDDRHWKHVRDSETWELMEEEKGIMPVLKLSYDYLPSHLKRCLSVSSLFPRGYEITEIELVSLWMALGLISSTRENLALEDVGVEYIKELWKRSLIQEVDETEPYLAFKVHDLVLSLAMSVAQNYCSIVDLDVAEILERVWYIAIRTNSLEEIPNYDGVPPFFRKKTSKRLRAIVFQYEVDDGVITRKFARTCISKCNHLRYLDLPCGSFEELPSSICNLKQLRSLFLCESKQLKKLPDTICELQSLLHLDVSGCTELGELPKNMKRLVSLRYLHKTTKQKSLQESGKQYPENLQFLALKACENLQVLFEGTCQLTRLRLLQIENCGRPMSVPFGELVSLECLLIENSPLMLIPEKKFGFPLRVLSIINSEQVMELLQCLNESACTLESFSIYDCPSFTAIPEWLFTHARLREIVLIRCPNLSTMPHGIRSLTALKELYIEHCGELSKRCEPQTGEDWHKIAHIPRIQLDLINVQWTDV